MDSLAHHLPNPSVFLFGPLGFASLVLASDLFTEVCSWMLQLLGTNSHLLSSENWLHTGTGGLLLIAKTQKLHMMQFNKLQNTLVNCMPSPGCKSKS